MRANMQVQIITDASPWGIGAVLVATGVVEYIADQVSKHDETVMNIAAGTHLGQQAREALAVLVAMRAWKEYWCDVRVSLALRGDNVGALTTVAKLQASSPSLRLVARELALEIADGSFAPDVVEHIAGVANVLAGKLCRKFDPRVADWSLPNELRDATRRECVIRTPAWWKTVARPSLLISEVLQGS